MQILESVDGNLILQTLLLCKIGPNKVPRFLFTKETFCLALKIGLIIMAKLVKFVFFQNIGVLKKMLV